jgi:hypothetical protein
VIGTRHFTDHKSLALIFVCIMATLAAGCVPPLIISGTASGAAPVAFDHTGRGQAQSYWIARYDDVIAAALRTAEVLSLEIKEEKIGPVKTCLRLQDARTDGIDLVIERRTDTVTSLQFDVGWFGSVALGRLVARQIIFELKDAGAFLEDWTPIRTEW